jgi:translation initiation factor 1
MAKIVYSTDPRFRHQDKICPGCRQIPSRCHCKGTTPPGLDGFVRLQRQIKGRNGKPVVLITGLPLAKAELKALAKKLKSKCGVGGSIDGSTIIIQGDKRDLLQPELESMGYKVKLSGG